MIFWLALAGVVVLAAVLSAWRFTHTSTKQRVDFFVKAAVDEQLDKEKVRRKDVKYDKKQRRIAAEQRALRFLVAAKLKPPDDLDERVDALLKKLEH